MFERAEPDALGRRRLVLPGTRALADLPRARRGRLRSGTSTATSSTTSTTASARWCRGTPTRRSAGRSPSRYRKGTHFAAPTEDAIVVAEELARRFGLPQLALHELRLGVDDGRDPDRARADRPRRHPQDLRLLPRPPRRGDGLDRGRIRPDRPARGARTRSPTAAASRRRPSTSPSPSTSTTPRRWRRGSPRSSAKAASPPA